MNTKKERKERKERITFLLEILKL